MSSAGLPPEEVEYQEAHLYEDYTRNLAGLYLVLVVLAFISMVLRVASRRITGMRLAADDWTFLVGAVGDLKQYQCLSSDTLCKDAWGSILLRLFDLR